LIRAYVHDGKLEFYPYSGASAVCVTNGNWHMVVLTHDVTGEMKVYCDGVLQLTVMDSSNYVVVSSANTLRFFKDDGGDIGSGSVSRIHIFSRVLTPTEVADLNALDDASPLIVSAALTGAAQGMPFLWLVTGPGVATNLASGLPPGLGIDRASGLISGTATAPGVFDALITSTNGYGASTQTLRIVVSSSTNLLFREDFNNGFSANWNALSVDTNYFTFQPAMMDVRANNGETYGSFNRTVNLFAYSNFYSGNMMITLGVTRYEPIAYNWNRLCLVAWDDYDNNVRFAYGYGNGRQVEILGEQAQIMTQSTVPCDFTNRPFLLRLVKQGGGASDLYTAYYSTNGVDFVPFANNSVTNGGGKPTKLGFWFGDDPNQNNHALIDYFEVSTPPAADPIAAWLASFGLTGANAALNADPDHDGLKNIFEYGFGLNPTNAASVAFPAASLNNGYLVLTYRERTGGAGTVGVDYTAAGLTYTVQVTDDLAGTWQSSAVLVELVPGSRVDNGDGTETVSVRLKQTLSSATRKFVRLVLVLTP
jgi:hypothetical protein